MILHHEAILFLSSCDLFSCYYYYFSVVVIMVLVVQCHKKIRKRREIKRDEHVLFSEKKNLIPYDPQQCEI